MLKKAANDSNYFGLHKAVVQRISKPMDDAEAEFDSLRLLYDDTKAVKLSNKLIALNKGLFGVPFESDCRPELMLQAFIKVSELEPWIVDKD